MKKLFIASLLICTSTLFTADNGGDEAFSITLRNTTKQPITVYRHETNTILGPINIFHTTIPANSEEILSSTKPVTFRVEGIDEIFPSHSKDRSFVVGAAMGVKLLWTKKEES